MSGRSVTPRPTAAGRRAPGGEATRRAARESGVDRWWFPTCVLLLAVASDYEYRVRDPRTTLAGTVDAAIVLELFVYGAVAAYLLLARGRPPRVRRTQPVLFLACALVFVMLLSVVYATYPSFALVRAAQMCVLLGVVLAAARSATTADMHRLAHAFVVLVGASVCFGVALPAEPLNDLVVGRFTWLAVHPTLSGVYCGLATVIAVAYLAAGPGSRAGPCWPRWAYGGAFAVVGGALLATQTRGAVAGAVVAAVVVLLALTRRRARLELLLALGALLVAAAVVAGDAVVAYFERGETTETLGTLNSRTALWEVAADAVASRPMFGYGLTSARGIFFEEIGLGGGHNALVNVLVELGVVGVIVWLALVATLVVGVWQIPVGRRHELRLDRAVLAGILTFLLVDGIFYEGAGGVANVASTWLFVCVAWVVVARRSVADESAREELAGSPAR